MAGSYVGAWGPWNRVAPVTADRIVLGLCATVWLAVVGMSVAAVVALMDLGRGFHDPRANPHTSSVLYGIIIVSALIILAAIPMLLRARRTTRDGPGSRSAGAAVRTAGGQPTKSEHPRAQAIISSGHPERPATLRRALPDAAVDRFWLRGTAALMSMMGLALLAVSAATYLMAIGHDGFSWTAYGIAGFVTLIMPVVLWRYLRQLRHLLAA